MASQKPSRKRTAPVTTAAAVARHRVIVRSQGEIFTLPVNPTFADPNVIDESRGVDYPDAREVALATAGFVRAVHDSIVSRLDLRRWLGRQFRRRGGAARFVDELLAMEPLPAETDRAKYRAALLRSVERAGPVQKGETRKQSHGGMRSESYRRRIAEYVLQTTAPYAVLGVTGLWDLGDANKTDEGTYRGFRTQPDESADVRVALASPTGDGLIPFLLASVNERGYAYPVELLMLHGLHLELDEVVR